MVLRWGLLAHGAQSPPGYAGTIPRVEFAFDTRCDAILAGCAAAIAWNLGWVRTQRSWVAFGAIILGVATAASTPATMYGLILPAATVAGTVLVLFAVAGRLS